MADRFDILRRLLRGGSAQYKVPTERPGSNAQKRAFDSFQRFQLFSEDHLNDCFNCFFDYQLQCGFPDWPEPFVFLEFRFIFFFYIINSTTNE